MGFILYSVFYSTSVLWHVLWYGFDSISVLRLILYSVLDSNSVLWHSTLPRHARRIAPEKMSLQLADTLFKVYFMERNMKLLVDYSPMWPILSFPAYIIPEILYIWVLSNNIGITSPLPKLPLVNAGPDYKVQYFGWSGSVGFPAAAMMSKKLQSNEPTNISESAVQEILYEIEESMSSSTSFDKGINDIEMCSDDTQTSVTSTSVPSTLEITSPIPARKNQNKSRKKDHSNKGGVGSHKMNHQKLQLSVKVQI